MAESPIQQVSDTAFLVAYHRAVESARKDALFSDPLAQRLAGENGRRMAEHMPTRAMTGWVVAMRTVVIDGLIQEAVANGVELVVNLGAGLDTRPYRMQLPAGLRWLEVDQAHIIAFKQQQLATETPTCHLEQLAVDLADVSARRALFAALEAREQRMLVLTEGVVPYLDVAAAAELADDLHGLAHVEAWIVDYVSPQVAAYRRRAGADRAMGNAQFKFDPPDWHAFFAEHGWRARDMRYIAEKARTLGRTPPLPLFARAAMALGRALGGGRRSVGFEQSMGYAVMERLERGDADGFVASSRSAIGAIA